jgi:predicted nucleotidyltransferase
MKPSKPVEGYFIKTRDNLVFEVKGVLHPEDRYIAYLRYVLENDVNRPRATKLYSLSSRDSYLRRYHPEYLWESEALGRVLQSVPKEDVDVILDPVERLSSLRNTSDSASVLERKSVDLAEVLGGKTGVEWGDIGLTGSQLVGVAKPDSDIDLVIYGEGPCRKLHSGIEECFSVIPGMRRYDAESLDRHLAFRWGGLVQHWPVLRELEKHKRLQGVFQGTEFFIRLVKRLDELEMSFGDLRFEHIGRETLECVITDDSESIFTPCLYGVSSDSAPNLRNIVSYRGRFTEHVHVGENVTASGRIEKVLEVGTGSSHLQLVVGEDPTDYLLPC